MISFTSVFSYWRSEHASEQISAWRQALEMVVLYLFRRIGPGYYIQARWGRKSIPFKVKWNHMNRYEYLAFIERWNPKDYQKASQHKLIEKAMLQLTGFPTAPFLGYVHHVRGRSRTGDPLQRPEHLRSLLSQYLGRRLCFKRAEGFGGFGFMSYSVQSIDSDVQLIDQSNAQRMKVDEWWARHGEDHEGFVIEEYLQQHSAIARINASSVNTVRMWVVCTEGMKDVVGCYLRIGRASSQVDNISSGGLVCSVDLRSGRVCELLDPRQGARTLAAHPDSKLVLEGYQIPYWEEAKRLAIETISVFPHIKIVGLDIAFVETGPVVIELNVCPDYVGCARMDLPLKQLEVHMRAAV